jgi:hypothetical protein
MPLGAAIGGAVIGAGGNILASSQASKAQSKAAQTAADSSLAVAQLNNQTFKDTRNQNLAIAAPFYNNGVVAGNALTDLLLGTHSFDPSAVGSPTPVTGQGALAGYDSQPTPQPGSGQYGSAALASYSNDVGISPQTRFAYGGPIGSQGPDVPMAGSAEAGSFTPVNVAAPNAASGGSPSALDAFDRFRQGTNYQWRYDQGLKSTEGTYATKGALDSGAAEKAKITFGQNLASGELSNYMNLLASQQASGLSAAGAVMGVNTSYAGNVTAQNTNAANVGANAALQAGQANANMWGSVGSTAGQLGGALFQYGMGKMMPQATPMVPNSQSINVTPNGTANWFASSGGFG